MRTHIDKQATNARIVIVHDDLAWRSNVKLGMMMNNFNANFYFPSLTVILSAYEHFDSFMLQESTKNCGNHSREKPLLKGALQGNYTLRCLKCC